MKKNLDKFRGCIIGGAAGDALGYAVEFLSESAIRVKFGRSGITQYRLQKGIAPISDDTQMTLFTANALLYGATAERLSGVPASYTDHVTTAYREWYLTQTKTFVRCDRKFATCWLMNVRELYAARAPGETCLSAIEDGCNGTVEQPINDSKGCGGVMRVAPVGLYFGETLDAAEAARLGAEVAALTHGHEMGYIPAAMLVHIIRSVSHNDDISLLNAVLDSKDAIRKLFPNAKHLPEFLRLIDLAIDLSRRNVPDQEAIHALGLGWCSDEALAVAIYCSLKYSNDFDKALIAAVNHGGDSDSTGAITGNILGAYVGLSGIPEKYLTNLELLDVIREIADDLYYGCALGDDSRTVTLRALAWQDKYVEITYV